MGAPAAKMIAEVVGMAMVIVEGVAETVTTLARPVSGAQVGEMRKTMMHTMTVPQVTVVMMEMPTPARAKPHLRRARQWQFLSSRKLPVGTRRPLLTSSRGLPLSGRHPKCHRV